MEPKLRIAIVGTGGMGAGVHAPAWKAMEDVEITALCDVKREKALALAAKLGISEDRVCEDWRELLKLDGIDAVDIATPNKFHSEIAVGALKAGKHVFCEKPDAVNAEECARMKAASEESGKLLMVMM